MDVIQHQQLIDYMARFKEGIDAAQDLSRSRMVAKQSAAQAHAADVMGRENKNLDAYLKKIDSSKMSPADKQFWSNMALYTSGFEGTPQGGSISGENIGGIYKSLAPTWMSGNVPPGGVAAGMRNLIPFPQFDNSGNVVNQQQPQQSGTPPAPPSAAATNVPSATKTTTDNNAANAENTGDSDTEQFY